MYSLTRIYNKAYLYKYPDPMNPTLTTYLGFAENGANDPINGGIIAGSVSTESTASEGAIVVLYESIYNTPIAETVTDGLGYFQFSNLNRQLMYHMIVKNTNPEWEYRISSRRTPI